MFFGCFDEFKDQQFFEEHPYANIYFGGKKHGVELPEGIQKFLNKAEAINMMGLEKVNGATAADVEGMLKTQFGSSLEETYHELNELTVLLNDMVAHINGDFVAPGAVRFL